MTFYGRQANPDRRDGRAVSTRRSARQAFAGLALLLLMMALAACNLQRSSEVALQVSPSPTMPTNTPTETEPPYTPLASFTPSRTLRPAPTFEPPTLTRQPTQPPSATPTPTINVELNIPGLIVADTEVPTGTAGCTVREDWKLEYTVRFQETLSSIADQYNTYASDLAAGNCLSNPDVIREGQVIRVPGEAHPFRPAIECRPWELLIPANGTITIPGEGQLTFNWRGPLAPRNVLRIYRANAQGVPQTAENQPLVEIMVEQRQEHTINLSQIPEAGTYAWRVFPLTWDYQPTGCEASYTAQFSKAAAPPPTPTLDLGRPTPEATVPVGP
ncbi:MAG: LysM peptidoglycan-binding domain-containing protein [bacterium]|nr:LysM peptidoglycan-binding domain-containing protein [bacterium]